MKLNKQTNFRHFEFLLDLYAEDIRETFIIKRGEGTTLFANNHSGQGLLLFGKTLLSKPVKWASNDRGSGNFATSVEYIMP